jgi:hypothetical protein
MIGLAVGCGLVVLVLWLMYLQNLMDPTFGPGPRYGWMALIVSVASYFLGLGWMIRIYRSQPEAGEQVHREFGERGLQGRRIARGLILLAIICGLGILFLWVAQPGFMDPMFTDVPWYVSIFPYLGFGSYLLGLGWMFRIYRAQPEPGDRSWRYHDI